MTALAVGRIGKPVQIEFWNDVGAVRLASPFAIRLPHQWHARAHPAFRIRLHREGNHSNGSDLSSATKTAKWT